MKKLKGALVIVAIINITIFIVNRLIECYPDHGSEGRPFCLTNNIIYFLWNNQNMVLIGLVFLGALAVILLQGYLLMQLYKMYTPIKAHLQSSLVTLVNGVLFMSIFVIERSIHYSTLTFKGAITGGVIKVVVIVLLLGQISNGLLHLYKKIEKSKQKKYRHIPIACILVLIIAIPAYYLYDLKKIDTIKFARVNAKDAEDVHLEMQKKKIPRKYYSLEEKVRIALENLFDDNFFGFTINIEQIEKNNGTVKIILAGDIAGRGVAADRWPKEVVEKTIQQYTDNYTIIYNGSEKNWRCLLSQKTVCE